MVLSRSKTIVMALVAFGVIGVAQQKTEKKWKDQAEYDLVSGIDKEPNPATRLASLDKWTKDYPQSDYSDVRQKAYLITYQQMNRPKDAFTTASEILKTDPNDVTALTSIVGYIYQFMPPSPAELETAEKASQHFLTDGDAIYAADKKPPNQTAEQWAKLKVDMKTYGQRTLGWIAVQRKDNPKAEQELIKALQLDPTQAQTSYMLAQAVLAQNKEKPEKQPFALFEYARAAAYDGPNSLPAAQRAPVQQFLERAYKTYHGSDEGLDKLLASAKTNALPPGEFKVTNLAEIEEAKAKADEAAKAAMGPMMALWTSIKTALAGADGQAYFDMNMKDALLPGGAGGVMKFKGKIISMTPANRPKQIVLGIEKADAPEVTLVFEEALPGKMEAGEELEFEGTSTGFTKEPFMVTFDVEKEKLVGWTGKNAPGVKKAAPKKKAQ